MRASCLMNPIQSDQPWSPGPYCVNSSGLCQKRAFCLPVEPVPAFASSNVLGRALGKPQSWRPWMGSFHGENEGKKGLSPSTFPPHPHKRAVVYRIGHATRATLYLIWQFVVVVTLRVPHLTISTTDCVFCCCQVDFHRPPARPFAWAKVDMDINTCIAVRRAREEYLFQSQTRYRLLFGRTTHQSSWVI